MTHGINREKRKLRQERAAQREQIMRDIRTSENGVKVVYSCCHGKSILTYQEHFRRAHPDFAKPIIEAIKVSAHIMKTTLPAAFEQTAAQLRGFREAYLARDEVS